MSVLLGSEVSELAWERSKLPTCFGGLGIGVAQRWALRRKQRTGQAVDLHKAVMTNTCEALNRPIREVHPEIAALAAKTEGSLLMSMPEWRSRMRPANCARQARGRRTSERRRSFARLLSRRQTVSRQKAWPGTWRSPSCSRGSCRLRKRCRLRSYTVKCFQNSRPSCSVQGDLALARAGRHAQVTDRTATECAMEDGHGVTAWCYAGRWSAIHVCSEEGQ